jgi:hypothetical protein
MNPCYLFIKWLIPKVDLGKSCYNRSAGAIATIQQADKLNIDIFILAEFTGSPIKGYYTSRATNTNIVHRFFTAND